MRSLLSGFLIVLTSIFLAGCSNSFEEQKVLFAEVMVIHDEVMPEMQTINELSKALDSKLKEIQQDSVRIDEDMLRKISENKTA